mgnify:CR=1 FL=1
MRYLVVYYSLSGTTRKVAELAAKALGAELFEVRTPWYRRSPMGYLHAGFDSAFGRLPEIEAGDVGEGYDCVLVFSPVWMGHASTPMRAFLQRQRGKLRNVAFVLVCGGSARQKAYDELAKNAGVTPADTCTLRQYEIESTHLMPPALARLVDSLKSRQAA